MNRTIRSKMVCILVALTGAGILGSGCSFLPSEEDSLPPPLMTPTVVEYRTMTVVKGTLVQESRMAGYVCAPKKSSLGFSGQGGRLRAFHAVVGDTVVAGQLLAELDTGELDLQVRLQKLEVEKCTLDLARFRSERASAYAIQRAELDLETQRILLDDLSSKRSNARIVAPFDGILVYLLDAPVGESVEPYQTIATIADTSELMVRTDSEDASLLPVGAVVTVESGQHLWEGTVVANPDTLSRDPDETLRKAALIRFQDGTPLGAVSGDAVRILHVRQKLENVIVVPRSVVHMMFGNRYVNVLVDGIREERDIEVGISSDTQSEIRKGLSIGDRIILD